MPRPRASQGETSNRPAGRRLLYILTYKCGGPGARHTPSPARKAKNWQLPGPKLLYILNVNRRGFSLYPARLREQMKSQMGKSIDHAERHQARTQRRHNGGQPPVYGTAEVARRELSTPTARSRNPRPGQMPTAPGPAPEQTSRAPQAALSAIRF
eukprot:5393100-Prymnesium_polylepis.1